MGLQQERLTAAGEAGPAAEQVAEEAAAGPAAEGGGGGRGCSVQPGLPSLPSSPLPADLS